MDSSPTIPLVIHLASVLPALVLGAWQLARPKGNDPHRLLGRVWVALMLVAAFASFGVGRNGLSWIHALSVFTIISVTAGLYFARRHQTRRHRGWMVGAWLGSLGAGIGAVAGPGRLLHTLMMG